MIVQCSNQLERQSMGAGLVMVSVSALVCVMIDMTGWGFVRVGTQNGGSTRW